ncbi:MAG: MBL fold metallo-hydrolase [Elusimicrobia bacterium]|nr:MBL fold metallo-hydrolase [Elusimicrobiota bacterium]
MKELDNIHWLGHSSFRIDTPEGLLIYIDPFHLPASVPKADLLLCTHEHHDHCSPQDIDRLSGPDTYIIGPQGVAEKLTPRAVKIAGPFTAFSVYGVKVEPVPAYNIGKPYHSREMGHLGYIITVGNTRIYHAGDTDLIPEMKAIRADIALLPVGGTYTMNPLEAAQAAALIKPALAVPIHYGSHVGPREAGPEFAKLSIVPVKILPEER